MRLGNVKLRPPRESHRYRLGQRPVPALGASPRTSGKTRCSPAVHAYRLMPVFALAGGVSSSWAGD